MLAVGRVVDRYVVVAALGKGGMAGVYHVRHRQLGTDHALKVLSERAGTDAARLLLEGRVQAGLRHPNIVAVSDVLEVDGVPALLMEYVPPPSLAALLADRLPEPPEAERLFRGIVSGVNHAHRHGLVHRDLKPANVLLSPAPGGPIPKIIDFGLAKVLVSGPSLGDTNSGAILGTMLYMPPEQIRDSKNVDRRADIFALGCMLQELYTGQPPYEFTDVIRLYTDMSNRRWRELPPSVPERVRRVVERCLEPEPEDRFGDCGQLLAMLEGDRTPSGERPSVDARRFLGPPPDPVPESAPPPPYAPPAAPARDRGRLLLGLAGASALGLAIWMGWPREVPQPAPGRVEPVAAPPAIEPEPPALRAEATVEPVKVATPRPGKAKPSAPVPAAAPAAPPPEPAPAPTPSPTAAVRLTGEGILGAWLEAGGRRHPLPASALDPGSYVLFVDWGAGPQQLQRITAAAGEDRSLRCNKGFRQCN